MTIICAVKQKVASALGETEWKLSLEGYLEVKPGVATSLVAGGKAGFRVTFIIESR